MKYNKIVTITLVNSFTLMIFASILASCQKNTIPRQGSFSNQQFASRGIASVMPKKTDGFSYFQDPKQIYIYCSMNSHQLESCYNQELKKNILTYTKKFGPFKKSQLENIKEQTKFSFVKESLNLITDRAISSLQTHIEKSVSKRKKFCTENSKFYLNRCLNQYLEKDTFAIINEYQIKHKKVNGHEYLFLKKAIEGNLSKHLTQARLAIEKQRKL